MILSIYYVCKCIYFLNSSRALLKIILYDVGLLNKDRVNNKNNFLRMMTIIIYTNDDYHHT